MAGSKISRKTTSIFNKLLLTNGFRSSSALSKRVRGCYEYDHHSLQRQSRGAGEGTVRFCSGEPCGLDQTLKGGATLGRLLSVPGLSESLGRRLR